MHPLISKFLNKEIRSNSERMACVIYHLHCNAFHLNLSLSNVVATTKSSSLSFYHTLSSHTNVISLPLTNWISQVCVLQFSPLLLQTRPQHNAHNTHVATCMHRSGALQALTPTPRYCTLHFSTTNLSHSTWILKHRLSRSQLSWVTMYNVLVNFKLISPPAASSHYNISLKRCSQFRHR